MGGAMNYPDAKSQTALTDGEIYQDFVANELLRRHQIHIDYYRTRHEQYDIGESVQGYEVKLDQRCTDTGRLSIEIAEKTKAANCLWVPSGIYRKDNTVYYVQGNYIVFYVFLKSVLVGLHPHYKLTETEKYGTIRTFYLPLQMAKQSALIFVNCKEK
jgi:hypothetical protein